MIIDGFASEYGWTIDQVLDLTMRQVDFLWSRINNRKNYEWAIWGRLHGFETKYKEATIGPQKTMSQEEQKKAIRGAQNAYKRLQERARKVKGGGPRNTHRRKR